MIDSHLVWDWEALLVDARAFSVAAAGDPFALPAQEKKERGVHAWELFTFIATDSRTKKERNMHQEQMEGHVHAEQDHKIKQNQWEVHSWVSAQLAKATA